MMRELIQMNLENILVGRQQYQVGGMSRLIDHPKRYCQNAGNEEQDSMFHPSFQALVSHALPEEEGYSLGIGKTTCAQSSQIKS